MHARLGKTDVTIPRLGFGAASLGNLYRPVDTQTAANTVQAAWEHGIRYFDTAPYYGFGLSERRLGDVLRGREAEYLLSTKVGRLLVPCGEAADKHGFCSPMPFEPLYDYSYDGVMRSFEDSLQRLGLSRIDILYMHDIGRLTHGENHDAQFRIAMDGGYKAMDELRSQGAVKAVGLGVKECEVCEQAMAHGDFDCFMLAGRYSLLEQGALERFLPACLERNISIVIAGVYNSGILAMGTGTGRTAYYEYEPAPQPVIERVAAIERHCGQFQVPLAAAALQFPLAHPAVASAVVGMGRPERVSRTVELMRCTIPDSFWQALKADGLLHEAAPVPGAPGSPS